MRQSPRGSRFLAGILLAAPFVLASCWGDEPTGERQQVPITLANHTGGVICVVEEDGNLVGCDLAANGGYRIIHLSLRDGTVVLFKAKTAGGGGDLDTVECKWRGETAIMVDYQVPQGAQTAQLLCVVWREP